MAAEAAVEAAKTVASGLSNSALAFVGSGLAIGIAALGGAVGIGNIFGKAIESAARQPEALPLVQRLMFIGFALVEAQVLYALLISFILLTK
jgi:F-type H+-transporting ATPase subunit c